MAKSPSLVAPKESGMKTKKRTRRTVMAIGDSGRPMPTSPGNATGVSFAPMGPGNICTAASLAWMAGTEGEYGGIPTELIEVRPAGSVLGQLFPYARFKCTPHVLYTKRGGEKVMGDTCGCSLIAREDVDNWIFLHLPKSVRKKLLEAVIAAEAYRDEVCRA